jgi:hypothetical protein
MEQKLPLLRSKSQGGPLRKSLLNKSVEKGNNGGGGGRGSAGAGGGGSRSRSSSESGSESDDESVHESNSSVQNDSNTLPEMITETQLFYLIDKNGRAIINSQGSAIWSMKTIHHGKKKWTSLNEVDLAIQEMIKASRNENYISIDPNHKNPHYFLPHSEYTIHLVSEEHENPKKNEGQQGGGTRPKRKHKKKTSKRKTIKNGRKKKGRKTKGRSKKSKL